MWEKLACPTIDPNRTEPKLKAHDQPPAKRVREFVDARVHARFKLQVDFVILSRTSGVLHGYTIDISESGISGMLKMEVPIGEVVQLDIKLPSGTVTTYATVRQRIAFRYGFQFLELNAVNELVRRTCRQLAVEQQ